MGVLEITSTPDVVAEMIMKCPDLRCAAERVIPLKDLDDHYYISHSRLNQKNDSFSIMGAKIWNSIPENLRNSSKSLFKEKVHATLLKIFEVQDRYADLNTIISDFKNY